MFLTRIAPVLGVLLLFLPVPATAQDAPASPIPEWSSRLEAAVQQLGDEQIPDAALLRLRDDLEALRRDIRAWMAAQAPLVDAARRDLAALGDPPAAGAEPEEAERAALRADLTARLGAVNGPFLEAGLLATRIDRAVTQIGDQRRKRFADRLLSRGESPLSPGLLSRAIPGLVAIAGSVVTTALSYSALAEAADAIRGSVIALLAAAAGALILVWPAFAWLRRRYGGRGEKAPRSFLYAMRAAVVLGATGVVLPSLAAALLYSAAVASGLLHDAGTSIGLAGLAGFALIVSTIALLRAFLPLSPDWRVVPIPTHLAIGLRRVVGALAVVFAIDLVFAEIIATFDARLSVTQLVDYGLTVAVTVLLMILLSRRVYWVPDDESGEPRWPMLRFVAIVALLAGPLLGAAGFVPLGRLIATQAALSGGLIFALLTVRRLGRESVAWTASSESAAGKRLRAFLQEDEASAGRMAFWFGLAFDFVLLFAGVVAGLFVWGADARDVGDWTYRAFFGFEVGRITFSLADVVIAITLFAALFIAARFVRRLLTEKVLPQTQLDFGIRQSIGTAAGYIGVVIAAAVGISALGLDLSNLAIVAGALSVGIGFGLQNVVNNFVSGLILLAERPVKVGDWIIVGSLEGTVKRINVRATEIETFDRASVFVPNSQLISEAVTNWTHADKLGRLRIPVGVAYGSDTRQVSEILIRVARANPAVMAQPEPSAVFAGFGDSSLDFELRCFIGDVNNSIGTKSALCFAIDDAFREAGIEIPFPQRDVHLKPEPPAANS